MQVSAAKTNSSANSHIPAKREPFFNKSGKGNFFSKSNGFSPSSFRPASIQAKLSIGQPNDKFEVEADSMADKVVQRLTQNTSEVTTKDQNSIQAKPVASISNITPFVQTKCASCEQEEKLQKKAIFESNEEHVKGENNIQRKCTACEDEDKLQKKEDTSARHASPDIENSLSSSKSSGNPLPADTRGQMESSFGADFSGVRIHNNSSSVQMNNDLNAQAFTHGSDIYFNSGKYDTNSNSGKHLLAHELTHVIQQGQTIKRKVIQRQDDTPPAAGSGSAATPPAQTTIPATMTCAPQGLSRPDFLARNGNDVSEFGHTFITVDSSMLNPSFLTFQRVGRSGRIKPVAVTATLPSIDSIYTQAGIFIEGSRRIPFDADGDCLTDTYDLQWRITTDGANKIRDGEQEHCDDYNYAYTHSVLLYVTEVNRLAAGSATFGSEREAKRSIRRRIGFEPNDWFSRFGCLLQQSLQRDRTPRGFTHSSHEPIPATNAPNRYNHCRYATVTITARSLLQVGQTPSASIITGC